MPEFSLITIGSILLKSLLSKSKQKLEPSWSVHERPATVTSCVTLLNTTLAVTRFTLAGTHEEAVCMRLCLLILRPALAGGGGRRSAAPSLGPRHRTSRSRPHRKPWHPGVYQAPKCRLGIQLPLAATKHLGTKDLLAHNSVK